MFTSYHIRRAHPSDRAQIFQLQAESALDSSHGVDDAGMIAALLDEPATDLDGLIRAGRYFVALAAGKVIAGAGWASQEAMGDVALMRGVCVHPDHRLNGIGRRLVEIAEDAAVTAGHGVILAPVAAISAQLFESMGYLASGAVEVELTPGQRLRRHKMWKHAA